MCCEREDMIIENNQQLSKGTARLVTCKRLTNHWNNRLAGDAKFEPTDRYNHLMDTMPKWYSNKEPLPEGKHSTFSAYPFYDDPNTHVLMSSGLHGPVKLLQQGRQIFLPPRQPAFS